MNINSAYAKYLIGIFSNINTRDSEDIFNKAKEYGFEATYGTNYLGCKDYWHINLVKDDVRITCVKYDCSANWHIDCGMYYKDKYYRVFDLDKRIGELEADGFSAPADFKRTEKMEQNIKTIKGIIDEAKSIVNGRRCGEIGGSLRSYGFFVGYDGFSCCDFSKGCVSFSAHYNYDKSEWVVEWANIFLADGSLSHFRVSTGLDNGYLDIENDYEAILADCELGKRVTEKDLVDTYTTFRVRSYRPRELSTLEYFDNFEDAKKYAFETAKKYAEGVVDDRRRYAYRNPVDISDKHDYLAAYMWYKYDRGSEHFIFVQGEK